MGCVDEVYVVLRICAAGGAGLERNGTGRKMRTGNRTYPILVLLILISALACADDSSRLDTGRAYRDLIALTQIGEHRRTGTENESKTLEFLESKLEDMGLAPFRDCFEADIFEYDEAWVRADEWKPACFPLYYTGMTGARSRRAEAVFLGSAVPQDLEGVDLKGKIAVFELLGTPFTNVVNLFPEEVRADFIDRVDPIPTNMRKTYDRAVEAGAVGVIAIVTFSFRNAHYGMNTFEFNGQMKVPGFMIPAEDGARLARLLGEKPNLSMTIMLDARVTRKKICNLMVEIPGQTEDVVVVSAPHTSWFKGAVERAGSAGLLELVRHFNQVPLEQRRNTLLVSYSTGHEIGWVGVRHFFETRKDYVDRTVAFVNMGSSIAGNDWVKVNGKWQSPGRVIPRFAFVSPNSRMREIAEQAIHDNALRRVLIFSTDVHNPGQSRFAKALRIPSFTLNSSPPYYHSSQDLIEHIKIEDFGRALRTYRQIVATLLTEDGGALKQLEKHKGDR